MDEGMRDLYSVGACETSSLSFCGKPSALTGRFTDTEIGSSFS